MNGRQFEQTAEGLWRLGGEGGPGFELDRPASGLFTLTPFDGFTVTSLEAVPGEYPESMALSVLRRPHHADDGAEVSFDCESRIPFGVPMMIAHRYKLDATSLAVQTSFEMPHAFELRSLAAGGLRFHGAVAEYAVVKPPQAEGVVKEPAPVAFDAADGAELYRGAVPPLALVLRLSDGHTVRFETGKDVWRWANAARIGDGSSTFILRREGDDLVYTWSLYAFAPTAPDAPPPPGRSWNITWSLQWGEPEASGGDFAGVFDLRAECSECACAQGVENALKKWVRTRLASAGEGDVFAVSVGGGRFCRRAGHLDRGRKKDLPHWDLPALREFSRWANRQLRKSGAKLVLVFGEGD